MQYTVVLKKRIALCDIDFMENMKGISIMKNAVEIMFDMSLFEPLKYFPNHATCSDKFWDIIEEVKKARDIQFELSQMFDQPNQRQVNVARQFNKSFEEIIVTNPVNLLRNEIVYEDEVAVMAHMNAYSKFLDEITILFYSAILDLIEVK